LYTHQPQAVGSAGSGAARIEDQRQYPSIWIADPASRSNHMLLDRAYDPFPSPNGERIAFFGWSLRETPSKAQPASAPSLWLFDVGTGSRRRIGDQNCGYVFWTHDGESLVAARFPHGQYEADISRSTIGSGDSDGGSLSNTRSIPTWNNLAAVGARDPERVGEARQWPQAITFQGVTKNDRYLMVNLDEYVGVDGSMYVREETLEAVDLQTGQISTIATARPPRTNIYFTWSWFDESDLAESALSPPATSEPSAGTPGARP
jgi:hypothetical protein